MGGKVRGRRVMISVSDELYAELDRLATLQEMPVATAIRNILSEVAPTLKAVNDAIEEAKSGKLSGVLNMQVLLNGALGNALQQQAEAQREILAHIKNAQKGPSSPS